ncbi:hypothetical protein VTN31DRAFT_3086 [Thermomyces dupontii]|uniref:uncharacterized protein n=1 Tax=Talaromyces thermophilus TaxID=28565 RepID=UPI0037436E36
MPKDEQSVFDQNLEAATKASGDAELARKFAEAAEFMTSLKTRKPPVELTRDELLELYAHFKESLQNPPIKQAKQPGMLDFEGKAKLAAWKKVAETGITPAEAQKKYIKLVENIKQKYGL